MPERDVAFQHAQWSLCRSWRKLRPLRPQKVNFQEFFLLGLHPLYCGVEWRDRGLFLPKIDHQFLGLVYIQEKVVFITLLHEKLHLFSVVVIY